MSATDKNGDQRALETQLELMLGFDDGVSDVLEHLLSIESSEDLMEYLTQLLGSDHSGISGFVADIGKFQKGQPLSSGSNDAVSIQQKKPPPPPAKKQAPTATKRKKQNNNGRNNRGGGRKGKLSTSSSNNSVDQNIKLAESNKKKIDDSKDKLNSASASAVTKTTPSTDEASHTEVVPKVAPPPPKGKATFICGCFGSVHKALANCLFCGRISCEREGFDYCPYCGYLVADTTQNPASTNGSRDDKAWKHKDRLLRFDREFAERTVIIDDQADYYQNDAWYSQMEQEEAEEKERERSQNLHQRRKMQLDIAF